MAKRIVLTLVVGFFAVYFQTLIGYYLPSADYLRPNLIVIVVVFLAFNEPTALGAALAYSLGVLYDLAVGGGVIGPWAGAMVAVFGTCATVFQRLFAQSPLTNIASVFLSSLVATLCYHLVGAGVVTQGNHPIWGGFLEAIGTALVSPPVFAVLKRIFGRRGRIGSGR